MNRSVIKVSTSLGDIQIRPITVGDLESLANLSTSLSDRDFMRGVIKNQLVADFKISDFTNADLDLIGSRLLLSKEKATKKSLNVGSELRNYIGKANEYFDKSFVEIEIPNYFSTSIKETLESVTKPVKQFQEVISKSQQQIVAVQQTMRKVAEPLRKLQETISHHYRIYDKWLEKNNTLFKRIREVQLEYEKTGELLDNGWVITPFIKKTSLYDKLDKMNLATLQKMKNSEINQLFVEFFMNERAKQLNLMIDSWRSNRFFKSRMKLICDAFCVLQMCRKESKSLNINPSLVIIPLLIAQIDGIILEIALDYGLMPISNKTNLRLPSSGQEVTKFYALEALPINSFHDIRSFDLLQNYLFTTAFPTQSPDNKIPERPFLTFSRHKIMHGEKLDYGDIDNTIRLFLILDFLANLKLDSNDSN
jgi:hypothetical protein